MRSIIKQTIQGRTIETLTCSFALSHLNNESEVNRFVRSLTAQEHNTSYSNRLIALPADTVAATDFASSAYVTRQYDNMQLFKEM